MRKSVCLLRSKLGRRTVPRSLVNANHKFPWLPALSAYIAVQHFGISPASVDDVTQNSAQTALFVGPLLRRRASPEYSR